MQATRGRGSVCHSARSHQQVLFRHVTRPTFVIGKQAHRHESSTFQAASPVVRRELVVANGLLEPQDPSETPWYKKVVPGSEFWVELKDAAALKEAIQCKEGKFAAIDMFAGWCASCKNAYPALVKVAEAEGLRESFTFYKCNVESDQGIKDFLKETGVKGIPCLLVFSPKGERDFLGRTKPGLVATLPATFKKIEGARDSLAIIASNSNTQKYMMNKDTGRVMLA